MYNRQFIIFSPADTVLFHRNDALNAEWTHQEFSLTCAFPYDPEKVITRGMRIAFEDAFGHFQLFEVRTVRNAEPDHTQDITAEHIIVSELIDRHLMEYAPGEIVNAQTAVTALLSGTGWALGQCTSVATHKPDLSMTNVWDALTEVRDMYGLRLEPYVTVSDTSVTGRYLDVVDNVGVWRGVRLSINKNINQVGVTYDDTGLVTAVYGYGATLDDEYTPPPRPTSGGSGSGDSSGHSGDSSNATRAHGGESASGEAEYGAPYVTIKPVVWTQTEDHPAKPAGQMYLEDPEATALYGRNGTPRFGFYSNSDVSDPQELITLCWEALKRQNKPKVTIECTCSMMEAYGLAGEHIQLGDTVRVEVEPLGVVLELMCVCLTEDLLDPSQTRPTIGKYIKDLVYITKEQENAASGGGGGGGANKEKVEQKKSVYTNFERTDEYILLQAVNIQNVEGALNTAYSEIYQTASEITAEVTRATGAEQTLSSRITVNADAITAEVTRAGNAESALQLTLDGITMTSSGVITIKGQSVNLGDYVTIANLEANYATITSLDTEKARVDSLIAGTSSFTGLSCTGTISTGNITSIGGFTTNSGTFSGHTIRIPNVNSATFLGLGDLDLGHYHGITCSVSGGHVTITQGAAQTTAGSDSFNIADTQFYRDGVSAAWDLARSKVVPPSAGTNTSFSVSVPSSTYDQQETYTFGMQKGATPSSDGYASVALSGTVVGRIQIGDWYDAGYTAGAGSGTVTTDVSWGPLDDENTVTFTAYKGSTTAGTEVINLTLPYTYPTATTMRLNLNANGTRRITKVVNLPFSQYSGTPLYTMGPNNTPERYTGTLYVHE
ncbi:MAG: phage tail protein [Acidaminococcaceae bacterium]|nr:phage tail protein [Acidaminococcaceae bacterium]